MTHPQPAAAAAAAVTSSPRACTQTARLDEAFDPRHNGLSLMRLVLALVVATAHALQNGFGWQPTVHRTEVGAVAVDAFFVVSGFLMVLSWDRLDSLRRYVRHRFMRIMPAFWVCLVVTAAVVAPLAALVEGDPVLTTLVSQDDPAWRYVVVNAALKMNQFGIGDLGDGVVNGALWTLFYEALCYGAVAVLGLLGVLRRRAWLVLLGAGVLWAALTLAEVGVLELPAENLPRLLFVFLLGSLAALYAPRLPMHPALALAGVGLAVVAMLVADDYRPLGAVGMAYALLWVMVVVRRPQLDWDLSYGTYIWHWPLQVLLVLVGATALGEVGFVVVSLVVALLAATVSWHVVERPALLLKEPRRR